MISLPTLTVIFYSCLFISFLDPFFTFVKSPNPAFASKLAFSRDFKELDKYNIFIANQISNIHMISADCLHFSELLFGTGNDVQLAQLIRGCPGC